MDRLSAPQANLPTETWQVPVLVRLSGVDDSLKNYSSYETLNAYDLPIGPS